MSSHRSLAAWKEARKVSLAVIEASRKYWKPWASALFNQVLRSSSSVQLNIAEGSSYGPSKTYVRFLTIAYGSAIETIEVIELLIDSNTIPDEFGRELLANAGKSRQILVGLLKYHRPLTKGHR